MRDVLHIGALYAALADLGIKAAPQVGPDDNARIRGIIAKGEPDRHGSIRGHRHTMLGDTDINAQRHLRGALGGLLAGVLGDGACGGGMELRAKGKQAAAII
jgi:cyanuric acid amidohydrolase